MRKEVVFAIFFGVAFGLIIAFGVWRLNISVTPDQKIAEDGSQVNNNHPSKALAIDKPEPLSIQGESKIQIRGVTVARSWVVVSDKDNDAITQATDDGAFSVELELTPGLNEVVATSYGQDNTTEERIYVVYSSQYFEESEDTSTEEAVQKRVSETKNPPIAYIGTVTDILENTIHVRNLHEDIEQTSVDDKTTYANDVTSKEISFSDIAIGDFVVAMGTKNGNQVLSAGRVLVSKTPVPIKRQIHIGDVIDISGNTLKLAQSEEEVELKFPKNWKGPEKSEMDPETRVAAITNSEGGDTIRTIQILN